MMAKCPWLDETNDPLSEETLAKVEVCNDCIYLQL